MTFVLGVDPGVVSGWALVGERPGKPLLWGQAGCVYQRNRQRVVERCTGTEVEMVLRRCYEEIGDEGALSVAVEGQFIPPAAGKGGEQRSHAVSSLLTARHAGIWIGVAQAHGLDVFEHQDEPAIPPNVWRAAVWGGRWRTEQAKRHAVELTRLSWGIDIPRTQHHTAEAIWIGLYAIGELRARAMQQQFPGLPG
jgi:hypothetical protein